MRSIAMIIIVAHLTMIGSPVIAVLQDELGKETTQKSIEMVLSES